MTVAQGSTEAVVFDCDGLLLDTEPLWALAERCFLLSLSGIWYHRHQELSPGRSIPDTAALLAREAGVDMPDDEAAAQLLHYVGRATEWVSLPLMPGAAALLDALEETGTTLAIASSVPEPLLGRILEEAGLQGRFIVTVGAGENLTPKPAPDVHRTACSLLGVTPEKAHAVESSQAGVDSARAAGLAVTGVAADPFQLHGCRQVGWLGSLTPQHLGVAPHGLPCEQEGTQG
ncbi:HAD family phosphatase [Streptomyces sp. NPDC126514]|uniref:HAD family hydrolase n=1 Tax=Streptomyces sp. NPDC126514 TaxID=3155210 RepID=UPI003331297E